MIFVNFALFVTIVGLLIPIGVLFVECMAALVSSSSQKQDTSMPRPRVGVLVPAHNEASGIRATIESILSQLKDKDTLVVIADNCTDETAKIARELGATVLERENQEQKGKGYALDYGLQYLEKDPPEVLVMMDADCILEQDAIDQIAPMAVAKGRPIQSTYLMDVPANPTPKDSVSALALLVKNLVRPRGLEALGLPCLLMGTGMAFPWLSIRKVSLASGNIVEDMQLGIDLAIAGDSPIFCSSAKVIASLPQQTEAAKSQRTRWEHGHIQTILNQVPQLLKASISQKRFDLLSFALDLFVPPLSLLVIFWTLTMVAALLAGTLSLGWTPAKILALEGLLLFISIFGAWAKFGRADIPAQTLLGIPFYILWKIPLYFAFLIRPQKEWVRTKRDPIETQ